MKIDIHVHTKERSACGIASETEQVHAAIEAGLDAIAFTDHHQLAPSERLAQLNKIYAPFLVLGGIEITIEGEDLLVLGVNDSRLQTVKWSYPELHSFVREQHGLLTIAHPFRYHSDIGIDIGQFKPDAIEMYSSSTPPDAAERILSLASCNGMQTLSNSDAHDMSLVGRYYNVLDRQAANERDILEILRSGVFTTVPSIQAAQQSPAGDGLLAEPEL